jgi:hypothetical protein
LLEGAVVVVLDTELLQPRQALVAREESLLFITLEHK